MKIQKPTTTLSDTYKILPCLPIFVSITSHFHLFHLLVGESSEELVCIARERAGIRLHLVCIEKKVKSTKKTH